jgi:outer membrane immunogenic protein
MWLMGDSISRRNCLSPPPRSVTGRLGYTWGPALLYAKGGYAWRDSNNLRARVGGVPVAFTTDGNRRDGYTVGARLEYMFAPNWSGKVEYQYYNFGSTMFTSGPADITGVRSRTTSIPSRLA